MDDIREQRRWWWMDRNNKFHDVPSEGHDWWALRFLEKIHYPVTPHTNVYSIMYRLGFIRVGVVILGGEDPQMVYEYDPKNPPDYHKIDLIKQLAIEYDIKWITDGIKNKKDRIMEGKLTKTLRKIIEETVDRALPDDARFGLGAVDANDAIDFKEFPRDTIGGQIHGYGENPYGRLRFRYYGGDVEWSFHEPSEETKQKVTDWLERRGFPVNIHKMQDEDPDSEMDEGMFPKDFKRHNLGTCMSAAALSTSYLLAKGIRDFKIVEGFVSMYPDQEEEDWSPHTWIEFADGRKFDPTKKQWTQWGFKPEETKYEKVTKTYTPEEYVKICRGDRSLKEIRLEPPVDNEVVEVIKGDDEREWRAWWMEPHGELHEVYRNSKYGHWKFAKDYVIKHGLVDKELADGLCVMILMDKGWVRLTFNYYKDGALHFDKSKTRPVNERTMSEVKSLAIELQASKLIDDNLNKEMSLLQENMTYDELIKLTAKTPRSPEDDTNRIDRSKTVNVRSLPVSIEENNEQWNFRYKSGRVSSVTDEPFEGHITFLKGEVEQKDNAARLECKVDCGCPDYMYKFAYNNYAQGAGDIGPDSENQAINRRPAPAYNIGEGLCKHLVALSKYLATKVSATKTQNIFEAINEVAKQGPFNVTYYDN